MTANVTEHPIDPSGAKIAGAAIDLSNNNIKSEANQMAAIPQPSIFVLNNDCIEMVLHLLPLSDLVAVAETCTQLLDIARSLFCRRHRNLSLGDCDGGRPVGTLNLLRKILVIFGSSIHKLYADYGQLTHLKSHRILNLVTTHRPQNLRILFLGKFSVNEEMGERLKPIFGSLQVVYLRDCTLDVNNSAELFSDCKQLIHLNIFDTLNFDPVALTFHFPNIRIVRLRDSKKYYMATDFHLSQDSSDAEQQIVKMFLVSSIDMFSTLSAITKNMACLETLQLNYGAPVRLPTKELQCGGKCEHLMHLLLDCGSQNVSSFINAIASVDSMKSLALWFGIMDDHLIDGIIKLKNLETLSLLKMENLLEQHVKRLAELNNLSQLIMYGYYNGSNPFTSNGIVELIKKSDKLEALEFTDFEWDQRTYDRIVEICRKRDAKVQLKIITLFSNHDTIQRDPEDLEYVEITEY